MKLYKLIEDLEWGTLEANNSYKDLFDNLKSLGIDQDTYESPEFKEKVGIDNDIDAEQSVIYKKLIKWINEPEQQQVIANAREQKQAEDKAREQSNDINNIVVKNAKDLENRVNNLFKGRDPEDPNEFRTDVDGKLLEPKQNHDDAINLVANYLKNRSLGGASSIISKFKTDNDSGSLYFKKFIDSFKFNNLDGNNSLMQYLNNRKVSIDPVKDWDAFLNLYNTYASNKNFSKLIDDSDSPIFNFNVFKDYSENEISDIIETYIDIKDSGDVDALNKFNRAINTKDLSVLNKLETAIGNEPGINKNKTLSNDMSKLFDRILNSDTTKEQFVNAIKNNSEIQNLIKEIK